MKKTTVQNGELQTVDFSLLEAEGSFTCPTCGDRISPDDESEEVYQILETKMVGNELSELVISCNRCGTIIRLTGFQQLVAGV